MYTPNEVREISFGKAVFGGYDMGDVDRAFASVSEDYATLFKENTMLKKKLKLLADTVEDYRGVDEAMRKALITAQNMANEMVAEAEKKSRDMLETATNEAKAEISSLMAQVEAEKARLAKAKAETAEFIDNITKLFDTEREKFEAIKNDVVPEIEVPSETSVSETTMSDTVDEIARSLEEKVRLEEEEMAQNEEEVAPKETPAAPVEGDEDVKVVSDTKSFETSAPTAEEMDALEAAAEKPKRRERPVFENLKFGTDYNIKDED